VILPNPVLVGREEELKQLQRSLDAASNRKGRTIFISGEAGSGKTRLVNDFLSIAKRKEVTVLLGWCLSNATIPYFPFIEALSFNLPGREDQSVFSQHLSVKSWLVEPYQTNRQKENRISTPQNWKDRAYSAVTRELLFMSSVKPLILVLEDIHWADSASLALLHYVSRAIAKERILVLATFRGEELTAGAGVLRHPLVETLRLMGREGLFREIKLGGLDQEGVRGIAESMVGGRVDPKLVEILLKESRGNPLFVVEFLKMLSEHGELIREKNQWRLSAEKLGIPSKVKEVIMRRIGALRPDQRRVVDVASVIGEKFDPGLIAGVLSKDRLEILEVLDGILKSISLVMVEENKYMFDHAKTREVLYEEISSPLKRGYHERVAKQIENANKNFKEISFNDLAYHFAQAGNKEKSVKYSLAAGQDALARFSNTEAIEHYRYVLETLAETDEFAVERNAALEGLADAYYGDCMFEEALKTFERLANSAVGAVRLRAYRKALDAAWFIEGDPSRMLRLVEKAEQYAVLDRLERARVLMNKGRAYFKLGDFEAALRAHEEGLQILKEEYSLPDLARSLGMTGAQRIICGRDIKKGFGEMQRSVFLQRELGNTRLELTVKVNRGIFFKSFGLGQELANEYPNMLKVGEKIGDFRSLVETSMLISGRLESLGKFEDAITLSLKALEYSCKTDLESLKPQIFAFLVWQYVRIGDLKKANYYFDALMKLPPNLLFGPRSVPWVPLAEAVLFAVKGQWKEADASFQMAFEISKKGMWKHLNLESSPIFRENYIWALELQGRTEEAEIQRKLIQEATAKNFERFSHVDMQSDLVMKKRIVVDEETEVRLDLVNVGRSSGSITKIMRLVPSNEFNVVAFPSYCCLQNGDLEMNGREIGAFQVETVKLTVKAVKTGVFTLSPSVVYVDDLGETKTCEPQPIKIIVSPRIASSTEKVVIQMEPAEIEFRSEAAQKAFDFLVKAFTEDYLRRRLPKERSGWRTLMNIVKETPISHYSMYGSGKHHGYAASELERLGVVEFRIFLGERGRGGRVLKLRVDAEKENIKNYIDQYISKGSKKTC
jgi:tetratricopeptide (TPR) repeat protein